MNPVLQWWGLTRKELQVELVHRFAFFNRLLLGPIVSGATTAVLFSGAFRLKPGMSLGGFDTSNYLPMLFLGFCAHACFNSGYYCLTSKFFNEMHRHTLPLLWTAPCGQLMAFAGLGGVELGRCLLLFGLGLAWVARSHPVAMGTVLAVATLLMLIQAFATVLGFLRAVAALCYPGSQEFLDYGYLAAVFTSCFYVPKTLLPPALQPLCNWNPGYHAVHALQTLWFGLPGFEGSLAFFLAAFAALVGVCTLTWKTHRHVLIERCLT